MATCTVQIVTTLGQAVHTGTNVRSLGWILKQGKETHASTRGVWEIGRMGVYFFKCM